MKHARVILTECGASVDVSHLVLSDSKTMADQRAASIVRDILEQVQRKNPRVELDPSTMDEAVRRGYWWADLGGEEFTVMIAQPQATVTLPKTPPCKRPMVEVDVEGGHVADVRAPRGTTVIVRDYDLDGADPDRLTKDAEGRRCITARWRGGGK
jgi:hypothetical protein